MIRKCFTINPMRTRQDFRDYETFLVKTKIYQGCEIFYPYNQSKEQYQDYCEGVKSLTKYQDFEIVCHLPYGSNNNPATHNNEDIIMDRLKQAIYFAYSFNIHKVTLHPGELDGTLSKAEAINISVDHIKELAKYAKLYKINIMIENLVGEKELCLTVEEMIALLNNINMDNVGVTFDCGHCHASHTENKTAITSFLTNISSKLMHLHLSDNHGVNDEHRQLGTGTIDFISYLQTLNKIDYQGLYSFEVLFNDYHDLINNSTIIDEYLKKSNLI